MNISEVIHLGDKVDIRVLQKVEQTRDTDEAVTVYKSQVLDIRENGNLELSMPTTRGRLELLMLGIRYELVFYSGGSLYRAVGVVKERYKTDNLYMVEIELKSQPEKFQRREYYRLPCLLDFRYFPVTEEQAALEDMDDIFDALREEGILEKPLLGSILDLSGGGLRFQVSQELDPDTHLLAELNLRSQTMNRQLYVIVSVISSKRVERLPDIRYEIRGKFVMKDDRIREQIIRYIFEEERRTRHYKASERVEI